MSDRDITERWLAYCSREYANNRDVITLAEFKNAVNAGIFK